MLRSGKEAGATGLEPAASGVTGRRSNQLNYAPAKGKAKFTKSLTPFQAIRNLQRDGVSGPLYLLQTLDKRERKGAGRPEPVSRTLTSLNVPNHFCLVAF